jgi:DNA-binding SARP family transcriptional activator/predicted ATPase
MPHLSIHVLGPFQVRLEGEPVTGFNSDKVRALLVYLALSPDRPHRREVLAGLLWPEFPERSARTNLRNALANLRHVLGEHACSQDCDASLPFLHSTRQTIQFNRHSDYWLDVDTFEELLAPDPSTSGGLEKAVRLVQGSFLDGFTLADAAPFEEWLLLRREHFSRQLVEALDGLSTIYEGRGDYENALVHARRRVKLEPWQEEGQRQLMRLLAVSGRRSEALAQYETLCRSLQEDLDTEPSAETTALWEAIHAGELTPEPALQADVSVPVWNLPASATPFFGRVDELAALRALLSEADTRLVTITGLGGSGKTRLALEMGSWFAKRDREAAEDEAPLSFPDGIAFAPLAALDSAGSLVPALADALRLRLEAGQEQLLEFLRGRQLLLILDNMEQLRGAAAFLSELLCSAPGIKILTTSRERLQMQGEHVLSLGGLPYPEQHLKPPSLGSVDCDAYLEQYPALRLLADGVQRVRPSFAPSFADLRAMLDICRLVDGQPLALELAASWADVLSLVDILAEARRSLDFWQADWPDLPQRQHSIRAVFDVSWRRLDSAEQAMFSFLTVFRGGFTREAAEQVLAGTEAIPRLLAALVRKSFLQYDQVRDRYGIHELLRQYGAEKLTQEPAREAKARDRHSDHYALLLQQWETDLCSARLQATLSQAETESGNIRAAWYWAVEQAKFQHLDRAMEGLYLFCWHTGRYQEADAALGAAAAAAASSIARTGTGKATCLRVAVRALAWQSAFCRTMGERDAARQLQQRCLNLLTDAALVGRDTRLERAILSWVMGLAAWSDNYDGARQWFEESFSLFRQLEHQWGMASALNNWGAMDYLLCSYLEAKRRLDEALAIWRCLGNPLGVADSLARLAYVASAEGRFEEAERLARQGYAASLDAGSRMQAGVNHLSLAGTLEDLGRLSEAHFVAQRSLAFLSAVGHRSHVAHAYSFLGSIDMHRGHYQEAREHAEQGLAMAREYGPGFCVALNLFVLGCLDVAGVDHASAYQHLQDSITAFRDVRQQDVLSWGYSVLSLAALGLGNGDEAGQHLCHAIQIAMEIRAVLQLWWTLPSAALLLVGQGENERAVELYALALRFPLVAKSRWFADVAGNTLAEVDATLPAERVAILQESGRTRDLEATVAGLLAELCQ